MGQRDWSEYLIGFGFTADRKPVSNEREIKYILLDVLLCIIAEYFYELCHILPRP